MDHLIKPDVGLIFWTLVNFALLVFLLGKFGWRPAVLALEMREHKIREDIKAAQQAREAAERVKAEIDARLKHLDEQALSATARAVALGEKEKAAILEAARRQAEEISASAKRSLEAERDRLVAELRGEVAGVSIAAAERILAREVDKTSGARAVEDFLRGVK